MPHELNEIGERVAAVCRTEAGIVSTYLLWVGNADEDRAFLRTTMLRAADLEPFLRRTRRLKLAALARPAGPDR